MIDALFWYTGLAVWVWIAFICLSSLVIEFNKSVGDKTWAGRLTGVSVIRPFQLSPMLRRPYSVKAAKTNAPIKTTTAAAIRARKTLAIRANVGTVV